MAGFSYRGKNIGDFGEIYYIPNESERGDYALPFDVEEETINGRDGAYYYGSRVEPRTFNLRCYYDGLSQQTIGDILLWFGRNTSGRLIFDDRDYAYYTVHPNAKITMDDYKRNGCDGYLHQGIMTIPLKAYRPFGRLLPTAMVQFPPAIVGTAVVGLSIVGTPMTGADEETCILLTTTMPSSSYTLTDTVFYVYNPGTEATPLNITLRGTATTGTITNVTNGQSCVLTNVDTGNNDLVVNSETGRVTVGGTLDFSVHDHGYICLSPCIPFVRNASIGYTSGSKTITSSGLFRNEMAGQFVYLNNAWRKIDTVTNENTAMLVNNMDATGTATTPIVTMNELHFDGFTLSKLEMNYSPLVR